MEVRNFISKKTGRSIPNQFIITDSEGREYFQSYKTIIAIKGLDGVISLDKNHWNCSVTTNKYRNQFLEETTKETQKKIRSGEYQLIDLN